MEIDLWALIVAILLIAMFALAKRWRDSFKAPSFLYSNLNALQTKPSWRVSLVKLIPILEYVTLGLFLAAFLDPRLQLKKESPISTEGIAIYLVVDRSGSMEEKSSVSSTRLAANVPSKIELVKQITQKFVFGDAALGLAGRPNDLIGLVAFARKAQVLVPLTLDHAAITKALSQLEVVHNKTEDGTTIGYAILKTVNIIEETRQDLNGLAAQGQPPYEMRSASIILLTDGFQEPNPLDQGKRLRTIGIMEAVQYAKEKNVRVYFINVEPAFSRAEFEPHRHLFQRAAEATGGKFFLLSSGLGLDKVYASIDKLEKSAVPAALSEGISKDMQPQRYQRVSFYPFLIAAGMLSLLLVMGVKAWFLRMAP